MVSLSGCDPPLGHLRCCKEQLPVRHGVSRLGCAKVCLLWGRRPTHRRGYSIDIPGSSSIASRTPSWKRGGLVGATWPAKGRDHYRARVGCRASKAGTGTVVRSTRQMGDKTVFWRCCFAAASTTKRYFWRCGFGAASTI